MVDVVQLVRASDCGSECRGFESHLPPKKNPVNLSIYRISCFITFYLSILPKKSIIYYLAKYYMILAQVIYDTLPSILNYLIIVTSPVLESLTMLEGL